MTRSVRLTVAALLVLLATARSAPAAPIVPTDLLPESKGDQMPPLLEPAAFTWTGAVSDAATDPANWRVVGASSAPLPGPGDDVYFTASAVDCVGLKSTPPSASAHAHGATASPLSFNSLNVAADYSGTVTLGRAVTVNTLVVTGGAIAQRDPATGAGCDLTVLARFTWTGGTLNSSPVLANLNLNGAAATIAPTAVGMVRCGAAINLNGAAATLRAGAVRFTNPGSGVNLNADSEMNIDPGDGNQFGFEIESTFRVANGVQLNLRPGNRFDLKSGKWLNAVPFKNTGGSFIVQPGAIASFAGQVDGGKVVRNSIWQVAGVVYLYRGAMLVAGDGFFMSGGQLQFSLDRGPGGPCTVVGHLTVTGGSIVSGANVGADGRHLFGALEILGDASWTGGTFGPFVGNVTNGPSDRWEASGAFTIGGTAALSPTAVGADNQVVKPMSRLSPVPLAAGKGITAAAGTPACDAKIWSVTTKASGNVVVEWNLNSRADAPPVPRNVCLTPPGSAGVPARQPPEEPDGDFVNADYWGDVTAVTKDSITVRFDYDKDRKPRTFPASRALTAGGSPSEPHRTAKCSDGYAVSRADTYRLADVNVGDWVWVRYARDDGFDTCDHIRILKRPGGHVPPLPENPKTERLWKLLPQLKPGDIPYHEFWNAYWNLVDHDTPFPVKFGRDRRWPAAPPPHAPAPKPAAAP